MKLALLWFSWVLVIPILSVMGYIPKEWVMSFTVVIAIGFLLLIGRDIGGRE